MGRGMDNLQPKKEKIKADICIIGAGAGGLTVAATAAQMGASVVLIEQHKMGGDCLNTGCVPSKSLLAAAKAAKLCVNAKKFGIHVDSIQINFQEVMSHVKKSIDTIEKHDSIERFEKLGVNVIKKKGSFIDAKTVVAGACHVQAKRFVIATGSSPVIPDIIGMEKISYLTNETIFELQEKPEHLIVIGGGPIGCELSQAFSLLGTQVTLLEAFTLLPKDDKALVSNLREQLIADGMAIYENCKIVDVHQKENKIEIKIDQQNKTQIISGSHLLIATGRKANIADLNLSAAKVNTTQKGIVVDNRLRTSNKHIYAIGDCIGQYQFTHIAGYHASIITRNILFRLPAKINYQAVPWVTYTTPELAHVGLSKEEASKAHAKINVLHYALSENDRAIVENKTNGTIKAITTSKGKILGVSILAEESGELLLPWIMAIQHNRKINEFVSVITPYPTMSEMNRQVASEFYKPIIFSKWVRRLVKVLSLLP